MNVQRVVDLGMILATEGNVKYVLEQGLLLLIENLNNLVWQ